MKVGDLPPMMGKLKGLNELLTEEEITAILGESYPDTGQEIDFESFLRVYPAFGHCFICV